MHSLQQSNVKLHTGRVKWFGKGFGFIVDMEDPEKEYFVHHTNIHVNPENDKQARIYRKLELGEYVSFNVIHESDKMSAVYVTGVMGGPLMCESVALERQSKERNSKLPRISRMTIPEVSINK